MQRRRFIQILATSVASVSLSRVAQASNHLEAVRWNGYTLGAEGRFTLYTDDTSSAQNILQQCFSEIKRLEKIFSLYDQSSEISKLNHDGHLLNPSIEWQTILQAVDHAHHLTNGLFDPTIQPLWQAYDTHFTGAETDATEIAHALSKTDWSAVNFDESAIEFKKPKMQLTLNGIAQGFITDHITSILKNAGYEHVLVELGESRAIGDHPEKRPWNLGILNANDRTQLYKVVEVENQALATSGGYGSPFTEDGKYHHLIHPKTGTSETRWKSLSVIAPTATEADALSTGLSFADTESLIHLQYQRPDIQIIQQI